MKVLQRDKLGRLTKGHSESKGENNWCWKGDKVRYSAVHTWIRKLLPETYVCVRCNKKGKTDLANKSGKYKRDVSDWERLCRKCHMESDERLEKMKNTQFRIRLKDKICPVCEVSFHPRFATSKTNSRECGQILRRRKI